ncbi:MAG: CapA family protein, partial [Oryzihumus sp.]
MTVTLALAGDTMLGRGVGAHLADHRVRDLFGDALLEVVRGTDGVVLNLECCVSTRGRPWPGRVFHFRAPPRAVEALALLGVRCVTLANNHALDYGVEALLDTLDLVRAAGIAVAGAGADEAEARAPARVTVGGQPLTVVGLTDHPEEYAAAADRPGVAWADLPAGVPGWVTEAVATGRHTGAVLVMPHWGPNMTREPPAHVRAAARALVAAGATVVAGHSAHVFHGAVAPVLYDLGDFLDDYAVDRRLRNDLGVLWLVTL